MSICRSENSLPAHRATAHRAIFLVVGLAVLVPSRSGNAATAPPPPPAVWGYADLHAHQFANLGFGGLLLWGAPYDPNDDITLALPYSDFFPAAIGSVQGAVNAPVLPLPLPIWRPGCPNPGEGICSFVQIHGVYGLADLLNPVLGGRYPHAVGGALDVPANVHDFNDDPPPELPFDGWPDYKVLTAQQMYYTWLERSWRAGQRLLVMLAVNNEALCGATFHRSDYGCQDMPSVDRQIQAAKDLERFIDGREGGYGRGFYRIVSSGAEARRVMSEGKLAVVLGTEVDSLFGCKTDGVCSEQDVHDGVQHLWDIGVRHVLPVHLTDNAFGGAALYAEPFDFNNKVVAGHFFDLTSCPDQSMGFRMQWRDTAHDLGIAAAIANFLVGAAPTALSVVAQLALSESALPPRGPNGPHCNSRGLTALGEVLVGDLMAHQMIIDIDHGSTRTVNRILDIAEQAHYPAIASGHTGINSISRGENRHEGQKTDDQLDRIRNLGGIVGVILHQGGHDRIAQHDRGDTTLPFTCGSSSDAWAQPYLYTKDRFNSTAYPRKPWPNANDAAVAFGSDFNGLAGWPAPRKGPEACEGDHDAGYSTDPATGMVYPFTAYRQPAIVLDKQVIGDRVVDYNTQGMASAGQVPDFIEDLNERMPNPYDLDPLFHSADAYATMWERAEDMSPPAVVCDPAPTGWQAQNVAVPCAASDWPSELANSADATFSLSTNVADGVEDALAATSSHQVCDTKGNCTSAGPFTAMVDRKAPVVAVYAPEARQYTSVERIVIDYVATDAGAGLASTVPTLDGQTTVGGHGLESGETIDLLRELSLGAHTFTVVASDQVGNAATVSVDFEVIVTEQSIQDAIGAFDSSQDITKHGIATSLLAKLANAAAVRAGGNCETAAQMYRAFIREVEAQTGKGISVEAAAILIANAQYLISHCP